jgi:hypothetical protein
LDHRYISFLPLNVPSVASDLPDRAVGKVFEFADELGEDLGPATDRSPQVAGNLAGQGQEHVGVVAKYNR